MAWSVVGTQTCWREQARFLRRCAHRRQNRHRSAGRFQQRSHPSWPEHWRISQDHPQQINWIRLGRREENEHQLILSISQFCLLLEGVTFPFYFDTGFGWQCVHEFRDDALLGAGAFFSLYLTFIFKEIHLRWFSNEKFFLIIEIYIFKKVTMKQMVSYSSGISQRYRSLVESVRSTKLSLPWHCFTCKGRGYNGNRRRPVIYK